MNTHYMLILLLAFSCNLDNLGVGISYGARRISIPFTSNFLIALITGAGTIISMLAGNIISNFIKPGYANFLGSLIIVVAGGWVLTKEIVRTNQKKGFPEEQQEPEKRDTSKGPYFSRILKILDNPFIADMDFSGHINIIEGFFLGLALAFNNLANGIGAGMRGLNPLITTLFVVVFSLITIWVGIKTGLGYASRWLGNLARPISGFILVVIGFYGMFF